MATSEPQPSSKEPDFGKLIEDYFSLERQRSTFVPSQSIEEMRCMVRNYSAILQTSKDVLDQVEEHGEIICASDVIKKIETALQWQNFRRDANIDPRPTEHHLLFRAAFSKRGEQPESNFTQPIIYFDDHFRQKYSLEDFISALAEHLCKTQLERSKAHAIRTIFTSMSPMLEWTMHTTGQRSKFCRDQEEAGLAVLDVEKLRKSTDVSLFRISDILKYVSERGLSQHIRPQIQEWTQNCDEYVTMGDPLRSGLIRWVPWSELSRRSLIAPVYLRAYTLAKYREWLVIRNSDLHDLCDEVTDMAMLLGGENLKNVLLMVHLILKPGESFWGRRTLASQTTMHVHCSTLACQRMLQQSLELMKALQMT